MTAQRRFRDGHRRRFEIAAVLALVLVLFTFAAAPPLPRPAPPRPDPAPEFFTLPPDAPDDPTPVEPPPPRPRPDLEPRTVEPADVEVVTPDAPEDPMPPTPPASASAPGAPREAFQAYSSPPVPRSRVDPEYPDAARALGIEGRVLCEVTLDASGRVLAVRILESDSALLERAAREALMRWTFTPAMQSGEPVASTVVVPILFRLR